MYAQKQFEFKIQIEFLIDFRLDIVGVGVAKDFETQKAILEARCDAMHDNAILCEHEGEDKNCYHK